jgi:hypothetical protein
MTLNDNLSSVFELSPNHIGDSPLPSSMERKGKDTSFIPPEGGRAAEAFQSLFSHTDGKILDGYGADGCGRKVVGTERLILTQQSPYL